MKAKNELFRRKTISLEEIDKIINKTFYANQGKKVRVEKRKAPTYSYYKTSNYVGKKEEKRMSTP